MTYVRKTNKKWWNENNVEEDILVAALGTLTMQPNVRNDEQTCEKEAQLRQNDLVPL